MSTVNRSIRINKEYDDELKKEAKNRGLSLNSLVNQIIEKYVTTYKLIEMFPCLIIPHEMIKGWLNGLPEDFIIKEGAMTGSYIPKHGLFLNKMSPNLDGILWVMEKRVSQHSNWYQFQFQKNNGKLSLLLRHNLGRKWSIYLNAYYSTLFKELLNINVESEIGEKSLEIFIPETNKTKNGNNMNNLNNGFNNIEIPINGKK